MQDAAYSIAPARFSSRPEDTKGGQPGNIPTFSAKLTNDLVRDELQVT